MKLSGVTKKSGRAVPFFSILRTSVVVVTVTTFVLLRIKCVYTFTSISLPLASHKLSSSRSFLSTTTGIITNNNNNSKNKNKKKKEGRCVIPENIPLDVLYEDHDMLVINKPSGMIMQFVSGSVERAVVSYLNSTTVSAYGTPLWPWETSTSFEGIVHRIDKETSGILVVAKHPVAAKALHESFHQRRVDKTYLAIAVGLPTTTTTTANAKQKQQTPSSSMQTETSSSSPLIRRNNNTKQKQQQQQKQPSSSSPEKLIMNQELEKQQRLLSKQIKNCGRDVDKAIQLLDQQHHRHQQKSDNDDHTTTPPDHPLAFLPNSICYNAAMGVCKRAGRRNKALEVFDSMKTRDIIPNIKCFLKAINLCSKDEQPTGPLYQKAVDYVMYLQECKLSPLLNLYCISSAISACGQANQLDSAFKLLRLVEEEEENFLSDDIIIDSSFDDSRKLQLIGCYNAMITACERCEGEGESSPSLIALKDRLARITTSDNDDDPVVPVEPSHSINSSSNNNNDDDVDSSLLLNKDIVVNAPIGRLGTRKRLMGIVSTDDGGRDAKSIVIPLAYNGIHSLNRIVIETGRTHQIRVHMSSVLDCPLVGDPMYASTTTTTNNNNDDNNYRCMLHAFELTIPHPTTGSPIKIMCDPPSDFSSLSNTIITTTKEEEQEEQEKQLKA